MKSLKLNTGHSDTTPASGGIAWLDILLDILFGASLLLASSIFDDGFGWLPLLLFLVVIIFLFWCWNRLSWYAALSQRSSFTDWLWHAVASFSMLMLGASMSYIYHGNDGFSLFWVLLLLMVLLILWRRLANSSAELRLFHRTHFISYWLGFVLLLASLFANTFAKYILWSTAISVLLLLPFAAWIYKGAPSKGSYWISVQRHRLFTTVFIALGVASIANVFYSVFYFDEVVLALAAFLLLVFTWRIFAYGFAYARIEEGRQFAFGFAFNVAYLALILFVVGLKQGVALTLSNDTNIYQQEVWPFSIMMQVGAGGFLSLIGIYMLIFSERRLAINALVRLVAGILIWVLQLVSYPFEFQQAIYRILVVLLLVILSDWVIRHYNLSSKIPDKDPTLPQEQVK